MLGEVWMVAHSIKAGRSHPAGAQAGALWLSLLSYWLLIKDPKGLPVTVHAAHLLAPAASGCYSSGGLSQKIGSC